eukprot:Colp12_sorted_trinity150504_noHs@26844
MTQLQFIVRQLDGKPLALHFHAKGVSIGRIKEHIAKRSGIPTEFQRITYEGRTLCDYTVLDNTFSGLLHVLARLRGGKGGFGSLLRTSGNRAAQKETTNFESCRTIDGRRLRNVNEEKKAVELRQKAVEEQVERARIKEEKKKKKRQYLFEGPKATFNSHEFTLETRALVEGVDEAVEEVFTNDNGKRPAAEQKAAPIKRVRVWGDDLDDLEDSEEEAEESAGESGKEQASASTSSNEGSSAVESNSNSNNCAGSAQESSTSFEPVLKRKSTEAEVLESPAKKQKREDLTATESKSTTDTKQKTPAKPEVVPEALDLEKFSDAEALLALGGDRLKSGLMALGLKCGGAPIERAKRLLSVKGVPRDKWPANILAK